MRLCIEEDVFVNKCFPFIENLNLNDISYFIVDDFNLEKYIRKYSLDNDVIFYGSFQLAMTVLSNSNWKVFCNLNKLNCSYYYPIFGNYLLNNNYFMLPFGDLLRLKSMLFKNIGPDLFIRPSSTEKFFTGKVVNARNYEENISFFNFYDVKPEEIVVISEGKNIGREWRFVIFENKVITGSQYLVNEVNQIPSDVVIYVQNVLNNIKYEPDKIWTLDVCEYKNDFKIVEVGSFSCAELYNCDYNKISNVLKNNF